MKINLILFGVSYIKGMAGTSRVQNLIDNLPEKENYIISNLIIADPNEKIDYPITGVKNNVSYKVIKYELTKIFSVVSFYYFGIKFIKSSYLKDKKNILYIYGYPDISNILFILYAKKRYKVLFDIVEDNRLIINHKNFLSKIKNRSSKYFFKRIMKQADGCITISHHLYNYALGLLSDKSKVFIIPISVKLEGQDAIPNNLSYTRELKIFYGGSFGEKDGLTVLFSAFDLLINKNFNISLILTGKGFNSNIISHFESNRPDTFQRIKYLGYLSKDEYINTLNSCDLFCMTRIDNEYAHAGFPFKLGEMLSTGKAVISSNVGDVSKYLTHMKSAIIVTPGDTKALSEAIEFLILNPNKREEIGKQGLSVAKKYFEAELVSKQLNEAFLAI